MTEWGSGAIHEGVKLLFSGNIAGVVLGLSALAGAQPRAVAEAPAAASQLAPVEVVASAKNAVADLGKQVVLGRFDAAIERMNPLWKERMAARVGGVGELEKQLAKASQQMVGQGVTILSFEPQGQPQSYEVGTGKKVETINGEKVESLIFTKWLVLVPTSTKFKIFPQGATSPVTIESISYQAAISDKGKTDWTFIDGSSLTVNDLRKMFINLPQDMVLPPIERRQAR